MNSDDYVPRPIPMDHVVLDAALLELVERLAEHAHDVWAAQRLRDGWRYGKNRCDEPPNLRHPCLIPYGDLPEAEKVYDRNAVLGTVRALVALGYTVHKW